MVTKPGDISYSLSTRFPQWLEGDWASVATRYTGTISFTVGFDKRPTARDGKKDLVSPLTNNTKTYKTILYMYDNVSNRNCHSTQLYY